MPGCDDPLGGFRLVDLRRSDRSPAAALGRSGFTFGDWLQPVGDNRKPRPTIADDCAATLYHFISTDLLSRIAAVLGDNALETRMKAGPRTSEEALPTSSSPPPAAWRITTRHPMRWRSSTILSRPSTTTRQNASSAALIVDADYTIGTGFIGTPALLPALTKLGMDDLAGKVFLQEQVPGWLYQVSQGATTIWERWDSMAPTARSTSRI
jgi:alpha-L-rhamnosidase